MSDSPSDRALAPPESGPRWLRPSADRRDVDRPRVVYIAGLGRSGSTLLDRMLGEHPDCVSVGELVRIWDRGLVGNVECACGVQFRECPFWSAVGRRAFGGWDAVDAGAALDLVASVDRMRFIPAVLCGRMCAGYYGRLRRYGAMVAPLYEAIAAVSGTQVVIDSSKRTSMAYVLSRIHGLDVSVVHLVRDSRGVAYSWTKLVRKPDGSPADTHMHRYAPSAMARGYLTENILLHALGVLGGRRGFIRYEQLLEDPGGQLQRIFAFMGLDSHADMLSPASASVCLGPHHSVGGNPMRFLHGRVVLRRDDEWQMRLPARSRRMVTAVTWPLLASYGYLRRRESKSGASRVGGEGG